MTFFSLMEVILLILDAGITIWFLSVLMNLVLRIYG
jgi:hypothetical protein